MTKPQKRAKCEHNKFKWNCDECGGQKRCELHGRVARTCRICHPEWWAVRILSRQKRDARAGNYTPAKATPKQLLELLRNTPNCCGCGAPLDYRASGFEAPCLHHDHTTGEVIGFAHRECNALEGQLKKLGERLPVFLKNFFSVGLRP
jgi:Recombination endonuclease VII